MNYSYAPLLDVSLDLAIKGDLINAEKILRCCHIDDPRVAFNLGDYEMRNGNY